MNTDVARVEEIRYVPAVSELLGEFEAGRGNRIALRYSVDRTTDGHTWKSNWSSISTTSPVSIAASPASAIASARFAS